MEQVTTQDHGIYAIKVTRPLEGPERMPTRIEVIHQWTGETVFKLEHPMHLHFALMVGRCEANRHTPAFYVEERAND